MGQTVAVLKSFIETNCNIPMAEQALSFGTDGVVMIDPLTLTDYPQIKPGSQPLVVRVERAE